MEMDEDVVMETETENPEPQEQDASCSFICRYCDELLDSQKQLDAHEQQDHLDLLPKEAVPGVEKETTDNVAQEEKPDIEKLLAEDLEKRNRPRKLSNSSVSTILCDESTPPPSPPPPPPSQDEAASIGAVLQAEILSSIDEIQERINTLLDKAKKNIPVSSHAANDIFQIDDDEEDWYMSGDEGEEEEGEAADDRLAELFEELHKAQDAADEVSYSRLRAGNKAVPTANAPVAGSESNNNNNNIAGSSGSELQNVIEPENCPPTNSDASQTVTSQSDSPEANPSLEEQTFSDISEPEDDPEEPMDLVVAPAAAAATSENYQALSPQIPESEFSLDDDEVTVDADEVIRADQVRPEDRILFDTESSPATTSTETSTTTATVITPASDPVVEGVGSLPQSEVPSSERITFYSDGMSQLEMRLTSVAGTEPQPQNTDSSENAPVQNVIEDEETIRIDSTVSLSSAHPPQQPPAVEDDDDEVMIIGEHIVTPPVSSANLIPTAVVSPSFSQLLHTEPKPGTLDHEPRHLCSKCLQNFDSEFALAEHQVFSCLFKDIEPSSAQTHRNQGVVTLAGAELIPLPPPLRSRPAPAPAARVISSPSPRHNSTFPSNNPNKARPKVTIYKCGKCGVLRETREELETHFEVHKEYSCEQCGKVCKSQQGLKIHQRVHKGQAVLSPKTLSPAPPPSTPSPVPVLSRRNSNSRSPVISASHPEPPPAAPAPALQPSFSWDNTSALPDNNNPTTVFSCDLCPEIFNLRALLIHHLEQFHRMDITMIVPSAAHPERDGGSSSRSAGSSSINPVRAGSEGSASATRKDCYRCEICPFLEFPQLIQLRLHLKNVHGFSVVD